MYGEGELKIWLIYGHLSLILSSNQSIIKLQTHKIIYYRNDEPSKTQLWNDKRSHQLRHHSPCLLDNHASPLHKIRSLWTHSFQRCTRSSKNNVSDKYKPNGDTGSRFVHGLHSKSYNLASDLRVANCMCDLSAVYVVLWFLESNFHRFFFLFYRDKNRPEVAHKDCEMYHGLCFGDRVFMWEIGA